MLYITLDDEIIKRAKQNRIAKNTRIITNCFLWSGLGALIINGTVGIGLIGDMVVIGLVNKGTKWVVKNRKSMIKRLNLKGE